MIPFKDALAKIEEVALKLRTEKPLATERRRLKDAVGAILSEDVRSPEDLPAFDNSAMDGFAVRSAELASATTSRPVKLKIAGSVVAGDVAPSKVTPHESAIEIMTGASLPTDLDSIVKIEDVKIERSAEGKPQFIHVSAPVASKNFVRPKGGDLQEGQIVLERGARVTTPSILAFAALGISKIAVFRRLKMARISTGKEIVAHDGPVGPGQVRNSTAPYFGSLLPLFDAELVVERSVGDEAEDFANAIRDSLSKNVDVIFTSGAVSMGKHDYVVDTIKSLGATVHFHKVAIQPGKPLLFASFPNGTMLFGLPGNPVSGTVGVRFFAETFLRTLRHQPRERAMRVPALAAAKKPAGLTQLAKAIVHLEDGRAFVSVMPGQMSSMVSPLLESNAWAVIEGESPTIEKDQMIDVYPVLSTQGFF